MAKTPTPDDNIYAASAAIGQSIHAHTMMTSSASCSQEPMQGWRWAGNARLRRPRPPKAAQHSCLPTKCFLEAARVCLLKPLLSAAHLLSLPGWTCDGQQSRHFSLWEPIDKNNNYEYI